MFDEKKAWKAMNRAYGALVACGKPSLANELLEVMVDLAEDYNDRTDGDLPKEAEKI